jgi:hypothetical protein
MPMERMTISMNESDIDIFERNRADMRMSKSAYIRYLIAEHENALPAELKYKNLIQKLSELNTSVKELMLTEKISDVDKVHLFEDVNKITELCRTLCQAGTK